VENKFKNLGSNIRALRRQQGLTQEQLAERANLHPTYVAKIELGERLPSLESLNSLAQALGVPLSTIVKPLDETESPVIHDSPKYTSIEVHREKLIKEIIIALQNCKASELVLIRKIVALIKEYLPD